MRLPTQRGRAQLEAALRETTIVTAGRARDRRGRSANSPLESGERGAPTCRRWRPRSRRRSDETEAAEPRPARRGRACRGPRSARRGAPTVGEAERRVKRLETEARTLAKVLAVDAKSMWPPVIDLLTVEKGFEAALGGALGDDLDAPIDANARLALGGRGRPTAIRLSRLAQNRCGARRRTARARTQARADRGRVAGRRRAARQIAQAGPAAGVARGRSLALGWLLGGRRRADRRGAPPRRTQPTGEHRTGTGGRAQPRSSCAATRRAAEAEVRRPRKPRQRPRTLARAPTCRR